MMKEPHRTRFTELIRAGASTRDMHDSTGLGSYDSEPRSPPSEALVQRELRRVEAHRRSLAEPLLARLGRVARVLDVGCGTGGSAVALALAWPEAKAVGIDANARALDAARVRAQGYDVPEERARFVHVPAGSRFPFEAASFDLVTCVSVLEFIAHEASRRAFVEEILRVLRPGGHAFLATPTPFRVRELHSRRVLGDWRRLPGFPWSSPPWAVHAMFAGATPIPLTRTRMQRHSRLRRLSWLAPAVGWAFPWQQYLFRKGESKGGSGEATDVAADPSD